MIIILLEQPNLSDQRGERKSFRSQPVTINSKIGYECVAKLEDATRSERVVKQQPENVDGRKL